MLLHYHVKNFALIEDASVDFGAGLNVLTGETGAGKSIMIDALNAAMGARNGAEVIRRGAEEAFVELVFSLEEAELEEAVRKLGIEAEEHMLLISRRIYPGRSLYKVNGEAVPAALIRQLTEELLDIHGQHEHQSLLKAERQREVLDAFAGQACLEAGERMARAFGAYQEALKEEVSYSLSEEERARRMDFLQFEMEEIRQAAVKKGEREDLAARYKEMSAFENIKEGLSRGLEYLSEGRENAAELLLRAEREIGAVSRLADPLKDIHRELQTAQDILGEAERSVKSYLEGQEFDEVDFLQVERRLDELHRLELKYGDLGESENKAYEKRLEEWEALKAYEEGRRKAAEQVEKTRRAMEQAAKELHQLREEAAPRWDKTLKEALKELNFLSVRIRTEIEPLREYTAKGRDRVSFTLSLNPGEALLPLEKVASGGELSRIMLAIKTILADKDRIPTVVFDEIDSGISGQTAQAVGRKLKTISRYRQVILITHLPQIAAPADRHYGIEKAVEKDRTITRIRLLDEKESLEELARLLGGDLKSESVYKTARELKGLS